MGTVAVGALVMSLGVIRPVGLHSAAAAIVRTQVDLGTLGGNSSYPVAINNAGQIAGWSNPTGSTDAHAFRWDPTNGMTDLGTLGGTSSVAVGMNNAGQVVGTSPTAASHTHGFVWDATDGMVDIGTLGGADTASPRAISDAGVVVGASTFSGALQHAFVWDATHGMVDIGTLGGTQSSATAVNNAGQVVGWAQTTGDAGTHAFVWDATHGMVDIGTIGGGRNSGASAINDLGQVAGITNVSPAGGSNAFRWEPGVGIVNLGTTGNGTNGFVIEVVGVSDTGEVTGWGFDPVEQARVFVANPTDGFAELDTGDSLAVANGVNASGQIVGSTWTGSGSPHAFMGDRAHGTLRLSAATDDLGALAINDSGQAAGRVLTGVGTNQHAVTWIPTSGHTVSLATAAVVEGDTGFKRTIRFAVTLSDPSTTPITVPYSFATSLSLNAAAGADWKGRGKGTLTFTPSPSTGLTPTTRYVRASVAADAIDEPDEVFVVALGNPSGEFVLGNSVVTARILNDDPAVNAPTVSVGDASVWEGDTGTRNAAEVWVTLDNPAAAAASVTVTVGGGSASSPSDYKAYSTTLHFAVGQRQKAVSVTVRPDVQHESDETVNIALSNPTGGLNLGRGNGTVAILNDD